MNYTSIKEELEKLPINPSTLTSYMSAFKKVVKLVFKDKIPTKEKIESGTKTIITKLNEITNIGTRKTVIFGWIKVLELIYKIDVTGYKIAIDKIVKQHIDDVELKEASDEQKAEVINWDYIKERKDEVKLQLTDKLTKYDSQYIMLCLLLKFAPMRSKCYRSTVLLDKESEYVKFDNYISLSDKKWIINKYKTDKSYGAIIIDIDDELIEILTTHKSKFEDNSCWLICTEKTKEQFTQPNFTHWLNTLFGGKKVSTTMLRQIYDSKNFDNPDYTVEERKKDAYVMGHSIGTAFTKYTKFSKRMHNKQDDEKVKLKEENNALKLRITELEAMMNK